MKKNKISIDAAMMKSMRDSFYRRLNPERNQEYHDSHLIFEDHSKPANLPDETINKIFNANRYMQSLTNSEDF